jgi:hypothetical protein
VLGTGTSDQKQRVTLDGLALEGTEQIRPDYICHFRSVATHFAFCGQGRGRNRLRDRPVGEDHPTNVRSDAQGREVFVRLCQTR